jgi:hypothetical protein
MQIFDRRRMATEERGMQIFDRRRKATEERGMQIFDRRRKTIEERGIQIFDRRRTATEERGMQIFDRRRKTIEERGMQTFDRRRKATEERGMQIFDRRLRRRKLFRNLEDQQHDLENRQVHVGFVVDEVALTQAFSKYFGLLIHPFQQKASYSLRLLEVPSLATILQGIYFICYIFFALSL